METELITVQIQGNNNPSESHQCRQFRDVGGMKHFIEIVQRQCKTYTSSHKTQKTAVIASFLTQIGQEQHVQNPVKFRVKRTSGPPCAYGYFAEKKTARLNNARLCSSGFVKLPHGKANVAAFSRRIGERWL
jgi:hypothetical protein